MIISVTREHADHKNKIYNLVESAFLAAEHSDGDEQELVNRLRNSKSYIKELSLIAKISEEIVGHIMFAKINIINDGAKYESLALAPLSVLPKFQNKGVGKTLIETGLREAKRLGYKSVIVLGSENYYPKFGFVEASKFNIFAPFEVPSQNFMAIELQKGALKDVSGTVEYSKEFFEK